jgi:uncharacterized DUF497 family protein
VRNITLRGLNFERAAEFNFETALLSVDDRNEYGETGYVAIGYLDDRLHVLCFTQERHATRVISFRKANRREAQRYEQAFTNR